MLGGKKKKFMSMKRGDLSWAKGGKKKKEEGEIMVLSVCKTNKKKKENGWGGMWRGTGRGASML